MICVKYWNDFCYEKQTEDYTSASHMYEKLKVVRKMFDVQHFLQYKPFRVKQEVPISSCHI